MAVRSRTTRLAQLGWAPQPPLSDLQAEPSPPSSALINVILEYADLQHAVGGGRTVLQLSARRMKDPTIKALLGRETRRLNDVSIIWDEVEGEIVHVHDEARDPRSPIDAGLEASERDTFDLTEAALAYIEDWETSFGAKKQPRARRP